MTERTDTSRPHWYVACVKSCQERNAVEALSRQAYQTYLPIVREIHKWSDRRKVVERMLMPHYVFVRCMEQDRIRILEDIPYVCRFMYDRCNSGAAMVRDEEMEAFRAMVEKGGRDVSISTIPVAPGDKVRVTSGPLEGVECELTQVSGGRCLAVRLGSVFTATMVLSIDTVSKIE